MPGNPVIPYDRTSLVTIAPFPDDFWLAPGASPGRQTTSIVPSLDRHIRPPR